MAKNIILLSDGTGNSSAKLFKTNVWRLYEALDLDRDDQIAIYDDGVGTSTNKYLAAIGGAFGWGLKRNVIRLYAFLCRNYEPGDRIYAFGFSRGAFTIRVLVGLINSQGLIAPAINKTSPTARRKAALWKLRLAERWLPEGATSADLERAIERTLPKIDDDLREDVGSIAGQGLDLAREAERNGKSMSAAWRTFLDDRLRPMDSQDNDAAIREDELRRRASQAYRLYRDIGYRPKRLSLARPGRWIRDCILRLRYRGDKRYDPSQNRVIDSIAFLGLWDTVDAYGLPMDELTDAVDKWIWPLKFREQKLCPIVRRACHALAVDDERTTFHPVLWDEEDEPKDRENKRIAQVWFSGMHANVGGGYPDDKLSLVSLRWIMDDAANHGLAFTVDARQRLRDEATPFGRMYNSRSGLASYYRYGPRPIKLLCDDAHIDRIDVHESVLMRLDAGIDGYGPVALPRQFNVVTSAGDAVTLGEYAARADAPTFVKKGIPAGQGVADAAERAWDAVWWRRIFYFLSWFVTILLAAFPTVFSVEEGKAAPTIGAWADVERSAEGFLSPFFDVLAALTPSFTASWIAAYREYPVHFLILAAVLWLLWGTSGYLHRRIRVRARQTWVLADGQALLGANCWLSHAHGIRSAPEMRKLHEFCTNRLLPATFVFLVLFGTLALISHVAFHAYGSLGGVCKGSNKPVALNVNEARTAPDVMAGVISDRPFSTRNPCWPTGIELEKGGHYKIEIDIGAPVKDLEEVEPGERDEQWADASIKEVGGVSVGPAGFRSPVTIPVMWLAVPFRRHLTEPWFRAFARIGELGADEYPLAAFSTVVTARKSGELFLYVNDAVFLTPDVYPRFYCNNHGTAKIVVTKLADPPKIWEAKKGP